MGLKDTLIERPILFLLVIANLAGTLFGVYYYVPQLLASEVFFWPLIPDSPTATFLFILSLLLVAKNNFNKKKGLKNIIYGLAFVGNIKYGIWTVFVLIEFMPQFLSINGPLMYSFLLLSHLGMFLQAFLILPYIDYSDNVLIAPILYLFNDLMDYSFQIHTSLPEAQSIDSNVAFVAYGLTAFSGLSLYLKKKYDPSKLTLIENKSLI